MSHTDAQPTEGDIWVKLVPHGREIRFVKEFGLDSSGEFVSWYIPGHPLSYVVPYFVWKRWSAGAFRISAVDGGMRAFKIHSNMGVLETCSEWDII